MHFNQTQHKPEDNLRCIPMRSEFRQSGLLVPWLAAALFILLLSVLPKPAQALDIDPNCPPPTICENMPGQTPQAQLDPLTAAADAVGKEINDRLESGDCTGLGLEGCLGLFLTKLMCAIDGRDWVQEACGGGGGGDDGGNGGGDDGGDGGGDDGGDGEETTNTSDNTESSTTSETNTSTAPLIVVDSYALNHKLREAYESLPAGKAFTSLKLNRETWMQAYRYGQYETDKYNETEYFAIVELVEPRTGKWHRIILGGWHNYVYAMDWNWYRNLAKQ